MTTETAPPPILSDELLDRCRTAAELVAALTGKE